MQRPLVFNDAFLTGIAEIDRQHRNLVDLTNEAIMTLGPSSDSKRLWRMVQELLSYAIYHFKTEEALMLRYGYHDQDRASAERHIAMHRRFSAKVVGVQEALQRGRPVDTDALTQFLCEWISDHIQGTDKELADHVLQRADSSNARPYSS